MKRAFFSVCLSLAFLAASAQENPYIVKTKNVKRVTSDGQYVAASDGMEDEETALDFVSRNFKFYSLCDWKKGMKFMVVPEKYDLVVKTFADAATGKEVSTMPLKYKIMIYQGQQEAADGHSRMNFYCPDNDKSYYYEIPTGTFEDYCYGKQGVPTLAYLGDVDMARDSLVGKTVYTKARVYYEDTDYDSDGFRPVANDKINEVKVVAVGVGTRAFPVKIIVEDSDGKQYFQNVAISKTNCGMRDDEFIMDNAKHLFENSFELMDDITAVNSRNYKRYIGKIIHTKAKTTMLNEVSQKEQAIPRMAEYQILEINPHNRDEKFTLKLKNTIIGIYFYKDVYLENKSGNPADEYFGNIFALGYGEQIETNEGTRAQIRSGHVGISFTEGEVKLAAGEPDDIKHNENGTYIWIFKRSNNKLLYVHFDGSGRVTQTTTGDAPGTGKSSGRASRARATGTRQGSGSWKSRNGTPINN